MGRIEAEWRVVGASVQGVGHLRAELPCQDAHDWRQTEAGILLAVLADGAGSASCAEEAAAFVVQAGLDALAARFAVGGAGDATTLRDVLRSVRDALTLYAETAGTPLREFATTLILLVGLPNAVLAAQVGDGAVIVQESSGEMLALTLPQNGEHANETTFLISPQAVETAQVVVWNGSANGLAMFSDGLQRLALKLPEATPHAPFFAPLFRFAAETAGTESAQAELEAFLRSPRITDRTDDDLTLLLACRNLPVPEGEKT